MVVRTAGDDLIALVDEGLRHDSRVLLHLLLVNLVLRLERLAESDRFGSDDVLQRTALDAGEDG